MGFASQGAAVRLFITRNSKPPTGFRPLAAALSQGSNLFAVAAVNGSLLLLNRDAFVSYSIAMSSGLILTNAIDPGVNQERLLGSTRHSIFMVKTGAFAISLVPIVAVASLGSVAWPLAAATAAYVAAYLTFTAHLTACLERNDWIAEARQKAAYSIVIAVLAIPIVLCVAAAPTALMLAQAGLMLAFSLGLRHGPPPYWSSRHLLTDAARLGRVLRNSIVRGLPLNVISNALLLTIAATGAATSSLALVRISVIAALLVNAVTPAGPQHFVRFSKRQRQRVYRALLGLTLSGCLALAALYLWGDGAESGLGACAAGAVAGGFLTAVNLHINRLDISRGVAIRAIGGSALALVAAVVLSSTSSMPAYLVLLSTVIIAASLLVKPISWYGRTG